MNNVRLRHLPILILAAGLCSPARGQAQQPAANPTVTKVSRSDREKASQHAHAAFDLLKAGQDEKAVEQFTIAIGLVEAPTIRVGRGDALVKLNRWVEAVGDYEAAIAFSLSPSDPPVFAKSRDNAKSRLSSLNGRLPGLVIETTDIRAQVTIDSSPPQGVVTGERLALDPGKHRIVVTAFGQPTIFDVEALEGRTIVLQGAQPKPLTVDRVVDSKAEEPIPATTTRTETAPVPATTADEGLDDQTLVAGTVTGVLALGAAVTGIWFLSLWRDYEPTAEDATEKHQDVVRMQWINTGITAGAVVAAGLTTYFWLTPNFAARPTSGGVQERVALESWRLPDGLIVGAGSHF